MIITFSESYAQRTIEHFDSQVTRAVERVSKKNYGDNVLAAITWSRGRRVRFTLETRDAYTKGSRKAASGRHMRKASWEAHRDVLRALFDLDPQAVVRTALATYSGKADFEVSHGKTAQANFGGSMLNPSPIRSTTVLP